MRHTSLWIILFLLIPFCGTQAQWQENGVPVATVTGDEYNPEIISDGAGGSIIVWQTYYNLTDSPDIYAQRLGSDGIPLWAAGGVPVCTAASGQFRPQVVSDGANGAIIAWSDFRTGIAHIYAQRIGPGGDPLWAANGVAVCTEANTSHWFWPRISVVESDGEAIIVWHDDRNGDKDIFAQCIDTTGAILWTVGGIEVCTETGDQEEAIAVTDEAGGAIAVWADLRGGESDIYAQRIAADSTLLWSSGGVPVCATAGDQNDHDAVADGAGGVTCVWENLLEYPDRDIYSQRIDPDGLPVWAVDGIPVCTEQNIQLWASVAPDGAGGAFYAWCDGRDAVTHRMAIYVQHLSAGGDSLWPAGGISIRESGIHWDNYSPEIAPDGFGGAIVAWPTGWPAPYSYSASGPLAFGIDIESVYVQRVTGNGEVLWQEGGLTLCDFPDEYAPRGQRILPDGTGGAIFSWYNKYAFDGTSNGIYAQRVNGSGYLPPTDDRTPPAAMGLLQNFPNPFNPSTRITFSLSRKSHVKLRIYDVAGRLVRVLIDETRNAGTYGTVWDGKNKNGHATASGVYFCRMEAKEYERALKMVLLR